MEDEAQEIERGQTISISRFFLNRRHYHYAFYHFSISPSPVLVSALRFSNSRRRTLEILSRRRRSIGRKEPEIVTQMNLKYCHFTFPPVSLSLSPLLLSDFPLSYLSFRHHHHLLHKRSPSQSLSLSNTHPLPCTVICFSFPFFLSNPLSSPLPTKAGVSPSRPFLFRSRPSFHPHPQTFPQRFPRSFSPPRTGAPPAHPPVAHPRVASTLPVAHDRCTWPHLQVSATERNRWRRQIEWKSEIAIRKGQK